MFERIGGVSRRLATAVEILLVVYGCGLVGYGLLLVAPERGWEWVVPTGAGLALIALRTILSVAMDIREQLERLNDEG